MEHDTYCDLPNVQSVQQVTLEKLKCSQCQKPLSIFPVYQNAKDQNVCGRCPIMDSTNLRRQELYECAVEFMRFPCAYRELGCLELLTPPKMVVHEQKCQYMKLDCPTRVYNNCLWQGNLGNLLAHFETVHPAFVLRDRRFELDFVNSHNENYLLPYDDKLFVVTREGNSTDKRLSIVIRYIGLNSEMDEYLYTLTLESGNKMSRYCIQQNFGVKLILQGDVINKKLNNPTAIIATINIVPSKLDIDIVDEEMDEGLDLERLKTLECPVCFHHLVPPIYQCDNGHSICETCMPLQTTCPMRCQVGFSGVRNYVLEQLVMNMIYPCNHQGCRYKTEAKNILRHEKSCVFGPFLCPLRDYLDCSAKVPFPKLLDHIKKCHYEHFLELDTVSFPFEKNIEETFEDVYMLQYDSSLFRLCFKYNSGAEEFLWALQKVNDLEHCSKYNFELEIVDNTGHGKRIYFKVRCTPWKHKDDTFDSEDYAYLEYDQIIRYMRHYITYRVVISKN